VLYKLIGNNTSKKRSKNSIDSMNKKLKVIGILLLVVFLLWNIIIILLAGFFGGCPPAYAVEKIFTPDTSGPVPVAGVHVTDQELVSRQYLKEAFDDEKWIMLPIGALTDFIPGNFFGPRYATNRMPLWEREYFVNTITIRQNTIWEYKGTYIKFHATTC
jgi:hypothetical protein